MTTSETTTAVLVYLKGVFAKLPRQSEIVAQYEAGAKRNEVELPTKEDFDKMVGENYSRDDVRAHMDLYCLKGQARLSAEARLMRMIAGAGERAEPSAPTAKPSPKPMQQYREAFDEEMRASGDETRAEVAGERAKQAAEKELAKAKRTGEYAQSLLIIMHGRYSREHLEATAGESSAGGHHRHHHHNHHHRHRLQASQLPHKPQPRRRRRRRSTRRSTRRRG